MRKLSIAGYNIEIYTPDQVDYEHFLKAAKHVTDVILDYKTFVLFHQAMEIESVMFDLEWESKEK